jgi:hypothetical protein
LLGGLSFIPSAFAKCVILSSVILSSSTTSRL